MMTRRDHLSRAFLALAIGATLVGAGIIAPPVRAQTPPDRSEVVLVLDFSASILRDQANRNRFGAALERIAARVDETSADLAAGDATVTIVRFATKAAVYPDCADLRLLGDPQAVTRFADCLRSVASAYRKGIDPAVTRSIGTDTNYVAAMEQAAAHVPPDAKRPTLILFTDGKHDVRGVPVSQVPVALERLFGDQTPFALLPVGMGLDPQKRDALAAGLARLQVIRDMPPCVSGTPFDWPQVIFETADEAGSAVATALQEATCTFTVAPEPTPTPTPTPTPVPTPGPVRAIQLTPGDGRIELTWAPPVQAPVPIVDYGVRCRAGDGDWIESKEGASAETKTTIEGLSNGTEYRCEVAALTADSAGASTPSTGTVTPIGRPAAPTKPTIEALDRGLRISVAPQATAGVSSYTYECSSDQGSTWPHRVDGSADRATAQFANLTNGAGYLCRVFAANTTGVSDASPVSDIVSPCGSALECNALLAPILAALGVVLLGGLALVLFALNRGRKRGYVVAVVDVVHTANLGFGSRLGVGFVRDDATKRLTGIVADPARSADVRVRRLRGDRFEVVDRVGRHVVSSGEAVVTVDSVGGRHELVLWGFATNAASPVTSRR